MTGIARLPGCVAGLVVAGGIVLGFAGIGNADPAPTTTTTTTTVLSTPPTVPDGPCVVPTNVGCPGYVAPPTVTTGSASVYTPPVTTGIPSVYIPAAPVAAAEPSPALATTGKPIGAEAGIGAGLVGLGTLLVLWSRKRRLV